MIKELSNEEVRLLLGTAAYIDVRSEHEFEGGHLKGAYNVPLQHMRAGGLVANTMFIQIMCAWFSKSRPLILGCQYGARSHHAAIQLQEAGFTALYDHPPGWAGTRDVFGATLKPGWRTSGYPCATEAEAGRDYSSLRGARAEQD